MSASTHIWLYSPRNTRLANIAPSWAARKGYRFSYLRYRRSGHEVTELILRMPKQSAPPRGFFALDSRIEVWRADGAGPARLDMETVWFVRVPPKLIYGPKGEQLIEVRAVNGLYLLSGRIVAYAAGSAQAVKIGPADNVMKAVVRENLGSLAVAERNVSAWLSVDSDVGQGASVYRTFPRSNVLRVLQSLSRASAQGGAQIFFDVVPENGALVFRTFLGQRGANHRHTAADPVTLSPEFGTLQNVERAEDHRDEFTVIYTAGQGSGDERMLVTLTDADRASASPLNRREQFVDARYIPTTEGLSTEADAALWRGRPDQVFSGVLPPHVYGRRVRWGDRATAELDGEAVECVLHGIEVELQDGQEVIRVDLRSDGADAEDTVRRIEGAIDASGGADAPLISVTPTPSGVPQAGPDGYIDIGWLDPAALPDPVVDWADVTGKPATFPPSAHMHTKANITDLETITATPTVGAVPKAGVGGTLADGWLSSAIARLTDVTWPNVSGKPATFPPSAHTHLWADITDRPLSLAPAGAADGDLYNDYPSPNVKGIHGFEFEDPNPSGQPDQGAVYVYDQSWPGWVLSDMTGLKGVQELAGIYKVPMAGAAGKIDDGWLNTTIARLTDITWSIVGGKSTTLAGFGITDGVKNAGTAPSVQTGPDASKPAAGTAGCLYVASDTARIYRDSGAAWVPMGVVGWADVTGKPTSFAPSAHAASHGTGGSDRILPANIGAAASIHQHIWSDISDRPAYGYVPAMNAIPQGNGIGQIDDGWLSANIARISDIDWFNLANRPEYSSTPVAGYLAQVGAGGTLADSFLSTNIPRLNAANTFSAAQTITTTHNVANSTKAVWSYNVTNAGVTPTAGFGQDHAFNASASAGTNRNLALLRFQWADGTDASRKGRILFYCYDAVGARECLRLESSGTAPMVGFNGVAAVARQSLVALTMAVGTGDNSVADVGTAFSQATLNNNFRDLVDKVNAIQTILVNVGLAS